MNICHLIIVQCMRTLANVQPKFTNKKEANCEWDHRYNSACCFQAASKRTGIWLENKHRIDAYMRNTASNTAATWRNAAQVCSQGTIGRTRQPGMLQFFSYCVPVLQLTQLPWSKMPQKNLCFHHLSTFSFPQTSNSIFPLSFFIISIFSISFISIYSKFAPLSSHILTKDSRLWHLPGALYHFL